MLFGQLLSRLPYVVILAFVNKLWSFVAIFVSRSCVVMVYRRLHLRQLLMIARCGHLGCALAVTRLECAAKRCIEAPSGRPHSIRAHVEAKTVASALNREWLLQRPDTQVSGTSRLNLIFPAKRGTYVCLAASACEYSGGPLYSPAGRSAASSAWRKQATQA